MTTYGNLVSLLRQWRTETPDAWLLQAADSIEDLEREVTKLRATISAAPPVLSDQETEDALILAVPSPGFGREMAQATIANLVAGGYVIGRRHLDLEHYKIRAAALAHQCDEKDARIEAMEVEIECNNDLIRQLEGKYADPDRLRDDRDERRRLAKEYPDTEA